MAIDEVSQKGDVATAKITFDVNYEGAAFLKKLFDEGKLAKMGVKEVFVVPADDPGAKPVRWMQKEKKRSEAKEQTATDLPNH